MIDINIHNFISGKNSYEDVFYFVKNAVLAQGVRSIFGTASDRPGNGCAYRGKGGCKCAVGHLIPDDRYTRFMEGLGLHNLMPYITEDLKDKNIQVAEDYDKRVNFLGALQNAHDCHWNHDAGIPFLESFVLFMGKIEQEWKIEPRPLVSK
jgi:hypothetical protein